MNNWGANLLSKCYLNTIPSPPYLYAVQTPFTVKNETRSSWMKQFIVVDVSETNIPLATHNPARIGRAFL